MRWPEIEREGRLRVRNSLGVKLWFSIFTSANMAAPPAKPSPQPQQDALYYLLSDLRTRDPAQQKAGANALCEYVLWETRDLRGEGFTGFMDRLYGRLRAMIESADELENIGGVCAIDALIDWKLGEHSAKLNKLDSFLRYVFEVKREEDTLLLAGNAFGHLLKVGNTVTSGLTAKTVDEMVTLALDWLVENSPHKLAAAIILKAVAESSPTIFNTSVPMFNEKIWIALHDENKAVRERAAEALGACLRIVQTRETRWRAQRYFRLFERTDFGMRKQASPESIHGSLIAIRELLQGAGEFMMARYQVVANIVLRFKHHKDPLIRRTITELVPMIALYLKAKFLTEYLEKYMQYLMDVMKNPSERASGFVALGGMANRVGISLVPYLDEIFVLLRDAIVPRKGPVCPEALICVGKLAQAIGKKMEDHVKDLLPAMLQGGLSPALVESLSAISSSLKDLDIEESLIRLVDSVLIKEEGAKAQSLSSALTGSHESVNSSIVQLALRTLGSFRLELPIPVFKQKTWKVVLYLEDADPLIRQEAAVTSCKLIASVVKFRPSPGDPDFRRSIRWEKIEATIFEIVKKLMVAVIDTEPGVRKAFMSCLLSTEALHEFIFHEDCVFPLFISLKDEVFEIRELAIKVLGRIRNRNPAFILSRMRDHRQYLLGGLDIMLDVKTREECTKLLGVLMRSCPEAVSCDYPTILETLISKLREAMLIESSPARGHGLCGNCGVVTSTLATLGDLSEVGGSELRQHLKDLLPLIVQALQDDKVPGKQRVAVMTLGKVLQSTGFAVNPIMSYPEPLLSLERLLNPTGDWALQREVMHVWGMLGVDPHLYKHGMRNTSSRLQMQSPAAAQSQSKERTSAAITTAIDETPIDLLCSATFSTSNEDFYPTVATNALLRVVMNSSTVSSQKLAITSLVSVLKVLGPQGCAPYLAKVMTGFFHIFRTCEDGLKGLMLEQLCEIVMIVRKPIHPYLRDLMAIILQEWSNLPLLTGVQTLLKKLYLAVNTPSLFEPYMPEVLPRCMQQLADAERSGDLPIVRSTLHMLEVFTVGFSMVHVHWVVPAVVRMFKGDVGSASVEIRREALQSLARLIDRLCKTHSVSGLVQSFFVPLIRVIAGPEESLRGVALDVLCIFAAMDVRQFGFALPAVTRIVEPLQLQHDQFRQLAVEMKERRWVQIDAIKAQLLKKVSVVEGLEMEAVDNGGPVEDLEESVPPLKMDVHKLKNASEAWNLSMREDWDEWMRQLSVKLLKESPSPALRSCAELAREQPSVAKELFSAAFVSCWTEMKPPSQEQLVTWFEHAFISLSISTETLNILLNLAEFMDRDEKPLPVHLSKLATLAEKCLTYAKTLHYREKEFHENPAEAVEHLIHIYSRLNQHEAAVGILVYAQQNLEVHLKESWYEELHRWEEALDAYAKKMCDINSLNDNVMYAEANLGRMRCLAALGRWAELNEACRENWNDADDPARLEMAPLAATAAWNMGQWEQMSSYVTVLDNGTPLNSRMTTPVMGGMLQRRSISGDGPFFKAVLAVHNGQFEVAREMVDASRRMLLTDLAAMVSESYERAYSTTVRVQQLTELEEVIEYRLLEQKIQLHQRERDAPVKSAWVERLQVIRDMWKDRLRGAARDAEVWQALLSVRSLVLPATADLETWLKFAALCRKSGRGNQAETTLKYLLETLQDPNSRQTEVLQKNLYQCKLAYMKHLWSLDNNVQRRDVYSSLQELLRVLEPERDSLIEAANHTPNGPQNSEGVSAVPLLARVYLKLGTWRWTMNEGLTEESTAEILSFLKSATEVAPCWAKAWHKWALFNRAVMATYNLQVRSGPIIRHVIAAVNGCVKSIALGSASLPHGRNHRLQGVVVLQDILRLLTLWFTYGADDDVLAALQEGFTMIKIDTWLAVIPQIIARIHSNLSAVREVVQELLIRIGKVHPQALMYPLLVACKSISSSRQKAAQVVLEHIRRKYPLLVDQAQLVSKELIRMAILWHEMWHEALEEASRVFFGEKNPDGMLSIIEPYHEMLNNRTVEPGRDIPFVEVAFVQAYGADLDEAYKCLMRYKKTQRPEEMDQSWEWYYQVFRRLQKQLPSLTLLDLKDVSPELKNAKNLSLAVPGTYTVGREDVTIVSFSEQLQVFTSKQRPRKLTIIGSDGRNYEFLLKGHEDLRQDERVMQLFGLVNALLADDRMTSGKDLAIQRYAVIPLAPNSGLIGWVPHCDTLHQLIREYRDARKIQVNLEHRLMTSMAVSIENLTLMGKVEVFEHALTETNGTDLAKVLWLKSRSSEMWLEHRTNYTRSLAVMSMVGYILGLGDRHPSNLMLNRHSGKVVHIDFGDCFEASMNREKFPERVPFRLTRMLINAMEVSGIEGTYRLTCENVMQVLRNNKDSVMAMMEAFVYDPLINWRLFNINEVNQIMSLGPQKPSAHEHGHDEFAPSLKHGGHRKKDTHQMETIGDCSEVLNERALSVMNRMRNKLTGKDFHTSSSSAALLNASLGMGGHTAGHQSRYMASHLGDYHHPINGVNDPHVRPGGMMRDESDTREEAALSVQVQVEKLIVQARSPENLCQSFIGWCPFW